MLEHRNFATVSWLTFNERHQTSLQSGGRKDTAVASALLPTALSAAGLAGGRRAVA
jgi:hypothetical protein